MLGSSKFIKGNTMSSKKVTSTILNPVLIEKQKLTQSDVSLLETLHSKMQELKDTEICEQNRLWYINEITNLEFEIQRAWKFEENAAYHTHWFTDPKCSCPKMDNRELLGTDKRIINLSCKLHGGK